MVSKCDINSVLFVVELDIISFYNKRTRKYNATLLSKRIYSSQYDDDMKMYFYYFAKS